MHEAQGEKDRKEKKSNFVRLKVFCKNMQLRCRGKARNLWKSGKGVGSGVQIDTKVGIFKSVA